MTRRYITSTVLGNSTHSWFSPKTRIAFFLDPFVIVSEIKASGGSDAERPSERFLKNESNNAWSQREGILKAKLKIKRHKSDESRERKSVFFGALSSVILIPFSGGSFSLVASTKTANEKTLEFPLRCLARRLIRFGQIWIWIFFFFYHSHLSRCELGRQRIAQQAS